MTTRLLVAVVAAGGLVVSFAVAQATGNRAAGAVVLVLAGLWCAVRLVSTVGWARMAIVAVAYAAAFALSHPLGRLIGSWTAVVLVSVAVGVLAWLLGPRQSRPTGSRVSSTSEPTRSTR